MFHVTISNLSFVVRLDITISFIILDSLFTLESQWSKWSCLSVVSFQLSLQAEENKTRVEIDLLYV